MVMTDDKKKDEQQQADTPELEETEDALDISSYIDAKYKWYIVSTFSGSEESAKTQLSEQNERLGLGDEFGMIYVPKTKVERVHKSGKRKLVSKTSFPGYIIVQMNLNDKTMACVTAVPKISGFVGNKKFPRPIKDQEVLTLAGASKAQEDIKLISVSFDKGEAVKVIDGPFASFDGVVEEVRPDKMKLRVLVSIFGRQTPVELTYEQVKKVS